MKLKCIGHYRNYFGLCGFVFSPQKCVFFSSCHCSSNFLCCVSGRSELVHLLILIHDFLVPLSLRQATLMCLHRVEG